MYNNYFIAIAKEKYDSAYQDICYLGIYNNFYLALEQTKNHNKKTYVYGVREFNYYIFLSNINDKSIMDEEDCIYSLTGAMYKENIEYIKEEYNILTTEVEDQLDTPKGSPPLWSCLKYKEMYKKVMKELDSIFTCHLCNKKSEDGVRYISKHDTSIVYCSTLCRNISGWIGVRYSN